MGDQFRNGGLPSKEWYELEEVAVRWSKMTGDTVTVKNILHYGETGTLDICMKIHSAKVTLHYFLMDGDYVKGRGRHTTKNFSTDFIALIPINRYELACFLSPGYLDFTRAYTARLYNKGKLAIDVENKLADNQFLPSGPVVIQSRDVFVELEYDPSPAAYTISFDDLVIPNDELRRFEQNHGIGQPRQGMPSSAEDHGPWPWGRHETELLRHLAAAAKHLWVLYDPDDPSTAPTNEQVSNFLVDRGVPKSMSDKMATILRPETLRSGRRKG